jgi:hypothetical protein
MTCRAVRLGQSRLLDRPVRGALRLAEIRTTSEIISLPVLVHFIRFQLHPVPASGYRLYLREH